MNDTLSKLEDQYLRKLGEQYRSGLQDHLAGLGEAALQRAYDLARQAMSSGLGVLDIAAVHRDALVAVLLQAATSEERTRTAARAAEFFTETLAPFEMTLRGFQEANTKLRELNETLGQRVADRTMELRQSEARFGGILNIAADAIISVDEAQRIVLFNKSAEQIFGNRAQEVIGQPLDLLLPANFREEHRQYMSDFAAAPETARGMGERREVFGRHKNGKKFPVEASISKLSQNQQTIFTAILRDATERKELEKERDRARELEIHNREVEYATQLKSQFLASMSHELRTPLTAIIDFSDLLAEQMAGQLNQKQERYVRHIQGGGHHLLQLINDILDLSKIEARQLELHSEKFTVAEALPEILSTVTPQAMAKKIQLENHVASDLVMYADRIRFKKILNNLLSNAVKFTPRDARFKLSCPRQGSLCLCPSATRE